MSALGRFDVILNIEPGERRLVGLLYLQYFFMGIASTFTQTTAFTLFLSSFSSSELPYTYVLMAVVLSVLTALYLRAGRRLSFAETLTLNLGMLLLMMVLFGIGLAVTNVSWLIFFLPVLFQIVVVFGNMAFWSLAGRILNVRQGKRLFGLVGAGEWSAIVIMGFLMPATIQIVGLSNLLWLAAAGVVGALITMMITTRLYRSALATVEPSPGTTAAADSAGSVGGWSLLRNRYVMTIFLLTLLWWVGFFFLDIIFYLRAAQQFPDSEKLAGFLGLYLAGLGVVTLLSNFLVAGRIVGNLGLRLTLLILSLGLTVGAIAMVATEWLGAPIAVLFWVAVLTKVWNLSVGFSVDQAAKGILYQPLPALLRTRVQTLADGVIQPIAVGLAGVALLLVHKFFPGSAMPLSIGLLVLSASLLMVAFVVGRLYGTTLIQALNTRRLTGTDLVTSDPAAIATLKRGLSSNSTGSVLYSMRALGVTDALREALPDLLVHPEPDVRQSALALAADRHEMGIIPAVHGMLTTELIPAVRGRALRTLGTLGEVQAILPYCQVEDPLTKAGAIIGLLTNRSPEGVIAGGQILIELFRSEAAPDRALAAEIAGEWHDPSIIRPLQYLMADPDLQVRRQAIKSAGHNKSAELWPQVIAALSIPTTRAAAASALVKGGEAVLSEIGGALAAAPDNHKQRLRLVRILRRIGNPKAVRILLPLAGSTDAELRSATLAALHQCRYRADGAGVAQVHGWIRDEIALTARLTSAEIQIGSGGEVELLRSTLAEQILRVQDRVSLLLSFVGDSDAIIRARDNLLHGSDDQVAYALETIEIHTPRQLRSGVLAVLDHLPPDQRLQKLWIQPPPEHLDREACLLELGTNSGRWINSWTQASSIHVAGVLAVPRLLELLESGLQSDDQLIRQTAAAFGPPADEPNEERRMLSTIEKVIVLRGASIFAETSDEILADVAAISTEVDKLAGQTVFEKGASGDSMFVIASGRVDVHDGPRLLNELSTGEVFGEMALLDPEPRSASVSAVTDTLLLRIDQQALYELIDDRPEVVRGLLKVLTQRLRARMRDLSDPRNGQDGQSPR